MSSTSTIAHIGLLSDGGTCKARRESLANFLGPFVTMFYFVLGLYFVLGELRPERQTA
jgi:hypothetical protein